MKRDLIVNVLFLSQRTVMSHVDEWKAEHIESTTRTEKQETERLPTKRAKQSMPCIVSRVMTREFHDDYSQFPLCDRLSHYYVDTTTSAARF